MKRKKILFDANPLVANKTGVGMYTERLVSALSKNKDIEMIGYYYNFLGKKHPVLPEAKNITYKQMKLVPGKVVNALRRLGIDMPVELLAKNEADIALYPNFLAQPSLYGAKSYAVLHDLSFITHPEYASDRNRKDLERFVPKTLKRCAGIITVSEVSKKTIVDTYRYPARNILVTPIPPEAKYEISRTESRKIIENFGISKPYVLFLGTLEPRKNLIGLLEAYESSAELNKNYCLVLAGGMDWKFEPIKQKITAMQQAGLGVIHCGYVSLAERAALYQEASVFTLPSHEEGFGMPILEAMQCNTPVAVSDIAVFHEVAGDAAVYFDQNSPSSIANTLVKILADKKLQLSLQKKSEKILVKNNWDSVAKSVIDFIS